MEAYSAWGLTRPLGHSYAYAMCIRLLNLDISADSHYVEWRPPRNVLTALWFVFEASDEQASLDILCQPDY